MKISLYWYLRKRNYEKISVLVSGKPAYTDQCLHYSSLQQKCCKESLVFSFFKTEYSIITNEYDLNKENARIKQVLRRMDVRKALLVKFLRELLSVTATDIQDVKPHIYKRKRLEEV